MSIWYVLHLILNIAEHDYRHLSLLEVFIVDIWATIYLFLNNAERVRLCRMNRLLGYEMYDAFKGSRKFSGTIVGYDENERKFLIPVTYASLATSHRYCDFKRYKLVINAKRMHSKKKYGDEGKKKTQLIPCKFLKSRGNCTKKWCNKTSAVGLEFVNCQNISSIGVLKIWCRQYKGIAYKNCYDLTHIPVPQFRNFHYIYDISEASEKFPIVMKLLSAWIKYAKCNNSHIMHKFFREIIRTHNNNALLLSNYGVPGILNSNHFRVILTPRQLSLLLGSIFGKK